MSHYHNPGKGFTPFRYSGEQSFFSSGGGKVDMGKGRLEVEDRGPAGQVPAQAALLTNTSYKQQFVPTTSGCVFKPWKIQP